MRRQPLMPRIRSALRRLIRSERGFAVPTVLMITVAGLGLGGAVVVASIEAQRGSVRDQDSKNGLAAADAGVELALYRQNKIATSQTSPCVVSGSGGALTAGSAQADGWCPAQSGTAGGKSFTYRVKPWALVGDQQTGIKRQLEVVSTGTSDNVSRRIEATASAKDGSGVFGSYAAIGRDSITINGSSDLGAVPGFPTNAASNGSIITNGNGKMCGDASHGVGAVFSGQQCAGFGVFENPLFLPGVDPGVAWTDNSNYRFFALDPKQGSVSWNGTTKVLSMTGNSRLTLGASDKPYSFCKLDMQGSAQIIIAQGAVVTMLFHSPELCGLTGNPVHQIDMNGNNQIVTTSGNPYDARIVMVGSPTIPTFAHLTGNSGSKGGSELTIYAPNTDLELWGSTLFAGAAAGKTLTLGGSADFHGDDRANAAQLPISIIYHRDKYIECTGGTMPSPPDSTC